MTEPARGALAPLFQEPRSLPAYLPAQEYCATPERIDPRLKRLDRIGRRCVGEGGRCVVKALVELYMVDGEGDHYRIKVCGDHIKQAVTGAEALGGRVEGERSLANPPRPGFRFWHRYRQTEQGEPVFMVVTRVEDGNVYYRSAGDAQAPELPSRLDYFQGQVLSAE